MKASSSTPQKKKQSPVEVTVGSPGIPVSTNHRLVAPRGFLIVRLPVTYSGEDMLIDLIYPTSKEDYELRTAGGGELLWNLPYKAKIKKEDMIPFLVVQRRPMTYLDKYPSYITVVDKESVNDFKKLMEDVITAVLSKTKPSTPNEIKTKVEGAFEPKDAGQYSLTTTIPDYTVQKVLSESEMFGFLKRVSELKYVPLERTEGTTLKGVLLYPMALDMLASPELVALQRTINLVRALGINPEVRVTDEDLKYLGEYIQRSLVSAKAAKYLMTEGIISIRNVLKTIAEMKCRGY